MPEKYELIPATLQRLHGETVENAISILGKDGLGEDDAIRSLMTHSIGGDIKLSDIRPPSSFLDYLQSFYSGWFWLLSASLVLMALFIYVTPQYPPFSYIRVVLGFVTALYLPGFSLVEALYPVDKSFEPLERLALSVGLSLALTPLTGFVLNYTPWGIRLDPILVALTLLTVSLGIVAVYRKFTYFRLRVETLG